MISIKTLSSYACTLFALCFISFTSVAESRCPCKNELIYRTDAIQQGTNLAGTFALGFAAAVRATDPATQEALVLALTANLTTPFSITIVIGGTPVNATDFNSLLALVQDISSTGTVYTSLVGSLSASNYLRACNGLRTLRLNGDSYIFLTSTIGNPSLFLQGLNQYAIVESTCDVFQIQSLTLTILNETPVCCELP